MKPIPQLASISGGNFVYQIEFEVNPKMSTLDLDVIAYKGCIDRSIVQEAFERSIKQESPVMLSIDLSYSVNEENHNHLFTSHYA